jgi:hypothetical protein
MEPFSSPAVYSDRPAHMMILQLLTSLASFLLQYHLCITVIMLITIRNINVFGLSFLISFSLLVALIDITLLKFLVFLSRFRRALAPRIDRWVQDGVWQLQRRAYEGQGYRGWVDLEKEIPMTTGQKTLVDLTITRTPVTEIKRGLVAYRSSIGSSQSYENMTSPHVARWI